MSFKNEILILMAATSRVPLYLFQEARGKFLLSKTKRQWHPPDGFASCSLPLASWKRMPLHPGPLMAQKVYEYLVK